MVRLLLIGICGLLVLDPERAQATSGALNGYFKLSSDEGRGFYTVSVFDAPEFVTVLKPTVNALGSPGLPERVREQNPRRNSLGSVLLFSSHRPAENSESQATLYEVSCSVPGIPDSFYVASAGVRQTIQADPIGFFYPRVRQQIAAFRNGGGIFLSDVSSKTSDASGGIVGVGPRSLLLMKQDNELRVSEVQFDSVSTNGELFEAASKLDPFLAYFSAHIARSGSAGDMSDLLPVVGSALPSEQDTSVTFRRPNQISVATRQTDDLIIVSGSANDTIIDRLVVVSKTSQEFSASDIGSMLASVAGDNDWKPAPSTEEFATVWDNASAGLRAVLNDRRNVFICTKTL